MIVCEDKRQGFLETDGYFEPREATRPKARVKACQSQINPQVFRKRSSSDPTHTHITSKVNDMYDKTISKQINVSISHESIISQAEACGTQSSKITQQQTMENIETLCLPFDAIPKVSGTEKRLKANKLVNFLNLFIEEDAKCKCIPLDTKCEPIDIIIRFHRLLSCSSQLLVHEPYSNHTYNVFKSCKEECQFLWDHYFNNIIIPLVRCQYKGFSSVSYCNDAIRTMYLVPVFMKGSYYNPYKPSPSPITNLILSPNNERTIIYGFLVVPVTVEISNNTYYSFDCPIMLMHDFDKTEVIHFFAEDKKLGTLNKIRSQRLSEILANGTAKAIKKYNMYDSEIEMQCWNFVEFVHSGVTRREPWLDTNKDFNFEDGIAELDKLPFFTPLYIYTKTMDDTLASTFSEDFHAAFYLGAGLTISMIFGRVIFSKILELEKQYTIPGRQLMMGFVFGQHEVASILF